MIDVVRSMQRLFARLEAAPLVDARRDRRRGARRRARARAGLRPARRRARGDSSGLPEVGLGLLPGGRRHAAADAPVRAGVAKRLILGAEIDRRRRGRATRHRPVGAAARRSSPTGRASSRRDSPRMPKAALAANKRCIAAQGDRRTRRLRRRDRARRGALYDHPETRRKVVRIPDPRRLTANSKENDMNFEGQDRRRHRRRLGHRPRHRATAGRGRGDGRRRRHRRATTARPRPRDLRKQGWSAEFLPVDLTEGDSITAFAAGGARRSSARVDILVNGAGWGHTKPFWEGTPELWDKLIALNFVGPMQLTKALLPAMMERGSGRIVNIASDAGRVGSLGRDRLLRRQGRADRVHQVAGARDGALRHQRQLRLPGADRHAAAGRGAREAPRGVQEGDPDAPLRQAVGDRRRGASSSPATAPATSPGRCSASAAA